MQIEDAEKDAATIDDDEIVVDIPDAEGDAEGDAEDAKQARKEPGVRASKIVRGDDAEDPDEAAKKAAEELDRRQARLAELERERDAERHARLDAEKRYEETSAARLRAEEEVGLRTEQAMRAHWSRVNTQLQSIDGALSNTKMAADAAERDLIRAQEEGDAVGVAAAQRALTRAEHNLSTLESGKAEAEAEVERARTAFARHYEDVAAARAAKPTEDARRSTEAPRQTQPQQPQITPEQWIDQAKAAVGDTGAEWLAANKGYITDPRLHQRFLDFANEYTEDNGKSSLKSEAFVEALERRFPTAKSIRGDTEDGDPTPRAPQKRTRATTSAPVSRGGGYFSSRNMSASQVRLPPHIRAEVKAMNLDPVKYALETVELIKRGELPKNFLD